MYIDGFHGDLNETFFVGKIDDGSKKLVQTAYECMMKGIEIGELSLPPPPPPGLVVSECCHGYLYPM